VLATRAKIRNLY